MSQEEERLFSHFMSVLKLRQERLGTYLKSVDEVSASPWLQPFKLLQGRRACEAPKAMLWFQQQFENAGADWPVDTTGACTSPDFWGLPLSSLVQLSGASERQLLILIYLLKVQGRLRDIGPGDIALINTERSGGFGGLMQLNKGVTLVPRMQLVVISRAMIRTRMTWILPEEAFHLMGAPLRELLPQTHTRLHELFTYGEIIVMAGQAYHMQSAMAFAISTLMLRPCKKRDEEDK